MAVWHLVRRYLGRWCVASVLALLMLMAFGLSTTVEAVTTPDITRLTDNGVDDLDPDLSGDRVVWYGYDGNDNEIFTWTPASGTVQLTDNDQDDMSARVSGDRVVWCGYDGSDYEIFTWTPASGTVQLTDNDHDDKWPALSDERVVWCGALQAWQNELYTWTSDTGTVRLTYNDRDEQGVGVSGDRVVWAQMDYYNDIFTWTPSSGTVKLASLRSAMPRVSGDRVVWSGYVDYYWEIFTWTPGTSPEKIFRDNNVGNRTFPDVSGDWVTWSYEHVYGENLSSNVYLWTPDTGTAQLTNSGYDDVQATVSGDRVVWRRDDSSDCEVLTWTPAAGTEQLTDNSWDDYPAGVSGDQVIWRSYDGSDSEIHFLSRSQQNDYKLTYLGAWSTGWSGSASGFSYVSTDQPGAAVMVEFSGIAVSLKLRTTPWYGKARVTLDPGTTAEQVDTIDLYSPSVAWKVDSLYAKTGLAPGEHTLLIERTGEKNSSSSGYSISLDAIDLLGTLEQPPAVTKVDDTPSSCVYAPDWSHWDDSGYWAAYEDTYAYTDKAGYRMSLTFDGTFASWVACTSNTKGKAEVKLYSGSVDPSNLISTLVVDLYSPTTLWKQQVYSTGILSDDTYVMVIECLYEKNPSSYWYTIDADRFDILGTAVEGDPLPPAPLTYQQDDTKIVYLGGGWSTTANPSASGGTYTSTAQPGATALAKFTGTEVTPVFCTGPAYGEVKLTLDPGTAGEESQTIDLYSAAAGWQVAGLYTKTGLADVEHTLVIENSSADGKPISLDTLNITGYMAQAQTATKIDDKDYTYFTYSPGIASAGASTTAWSRWDASGYWAAYDDTYAYADQLGYKVTFTFDGTFASWLACTSNTKGKAEVRLYEGSVDPGNLISMTTVDLYSSTTLWKQPVYSTGLLAEGTYVIEVECIYEKNPASWWYTIDVDHFDILATAP